MKKGDLVKWSLSWLVGCYDTEVYRNQVGVVLGLGGVINCYKVTWSDGLTSDVHRDYLEAL